MFPWPDWIGDTVVIVGTGPSAAQAPLHLAYGAARVIAIKSAWKLVPWADALYGIDQGWWLANSGANKFKGLKFSPSPTICRVFPSVRRVELRPRAEILLTKFGQIGCGLPTGGGHSGFQAINLAVQFGAKRIVLVGFDMTLAHGAHWSKDYRGVGKPDAGRVKSWRDAMDGCAPQFAALGIPVLNTSPVSALTAFPKVSLAAALEIYDGGQNEDRVQEPRLQSDLQGSDVAGRSLEGVR